MRYSKEKKNGEKVSWGVTGPFMLGLAAVIAELTKAYHILFP